MIVGVLIELSNKNVDRIFDYSVPVSYQSQVQVGIRVLVPFGKQMLEGFVLEIKSTSDFQKELREVIQIVDSEIVLGSELLFLGKKMQEQTLSTLISCYQVMLPKALKAKNGSVIQKKFDCFYRLNDIDLDSFQFNSKQLAIINLCQEKGTVLKQELLRISSSSLATLIKRGVLIEEKREHYRMQYSNLDMNIKVLTEEQKNVVSKVLLSTHQTYLLYGVTGSGKTEVYMELIDIVLKRGQTAIFLVPEISLTPQMVERFQRRFGNSIAALHSALSVGEKYDEWRRIARGEARIVIGARSAIFAPVTHLGIIIIDEEHSDSYKQDDANPRYHARDIAFLRGQYHNCPVILGSATPSLETMARAQKGVYQYLTLLHRVNGRSLPVVNVIDMNQEMKTIKGHFSMPLIQAITKRLERKEQVILFLNRRGYSSFITCQNCGYTFKCPNCDITLTYHKSSNTLRCHYCGYGSKVYDTCPECHEHSIRDLGVGTEKIEEELQNIFLQVKILRMDFDTTSRKGMHAKMIQSFQNREYDILLGTQIVAKGLDFDNVTLVGVINADTSLNIPDFRSSENAFSMLSQVAGRSGRSLKEGEVIIQTFNPEHYAISYVRGHDYLGFYRKEMQLRKQLKYPPFYYLCYLKIRGKDFRYLEMEANKIKRSMERNFSHTIILGPAPCAIFKMKNIYRYGIILKYQKEEMLYPFLEKIINHYKGNPKIVIDIDFNPSHF